MFNIWENITDKLQIIEWSIHQDIGHGISGIEQLVNSFGSFDFINSEYLNKLHAYDNTIKIASGVIITGALLYTTITDTKETPKLMQKIFLGLLGIALFIPMFSMVVGDVGGGIMNSLATESQDYGIGVDVINYTLTDYEAKEFHPDYKNWDEIDKIDITEKLDADVKECKTSTNCTVIRKKGDYRYETSMLFGILLGGVLFCMLLVTCLLLAKNSVELLFSGFVGLAASVLSMVTPNAPFAKNYWNALVRQMGSVFLMVACLKGYMSTTSFLLDTYNSVNFNFVQQGLMFFIINVAVIWTILDGAKIIEKVFGIDAGISKTAAAVAGNQLANKLGNLGGSLGNKAATLGKGAFNKGSNMALGSIAGSLKGSANDGGLKGSLRGAMQGASEGAKVGNQTSKPKSPSSEYRSDKMDEIKSGLKGQDDLLQDLNDVSERNNDIKDDSLGNSNSLKQQANAQKPNENKSTSNSKSINGNEKKTSTASGNTQKNSVGLKGTTPKENGGVKVSPQNNNGATGTFQSSNSGVFNAKEANESNGFTFSSQSNNGNNSSANIFEPQNSQQNSNSPFSTEANRETRNLAREANNERLFAINAKNHSSRRGRR